MSQKVALDLTLYLDKEVEYVPWKAALDNLAYIEGRIIYKEVYTSFKVGPLIKVRKNTMAFLYTVRDRSLLKYRCTISETCAFETDFTKARPILIRR